MCEFEAAFADITTYAFAAWDRTEMAAVACMVVSDASAAFAGASTLPPFRRHGAQTALLAARTSYAAELGAAWVFAETAEPTPPGSNTSFNNMIRQGFRPLYSRPVWRWNSEFD